MATDERPRQGYDATEEGLRELFQRLETLADLFDPHALLEGTRREHIAELLRLVVKEGREKLLSLTMLTLVGL